MGWDTDQFLKAIEANPTAKIARWIATRVQTQLDEIYVADLLEEGVLDRPGSSSDAADTVARLRADAERYRAKHHRASTIRVVRNIERDAWVERAETLPVPQQAIGRARRGT